MVWSPQTLGPGTTSHHQAMQGCLPSIFAFIPALSQIPCKYHAIQHHLQRLRLHQPAFTPVHTHHRSTGADGGPTVTMPKGGRGRGRSDAGAYILYENIFSKASPPVASRRPHLAQQRSGCSPCCKRRTPKQWGSQLQSSSAWQRVNPGAPRCASPQKKIKEHIYSIKRRN